MPNRRANYGRVLATAVAKLSKYPLSFVRPYSDWSLPCGVSVAGIAICRKQRAEAAREIRRMASEFERRQNAGLPSIAQIIADPAASEWLKAALHTALSRDPVDAANDAEVLAKVLDRCCRQILQRS
jgi:hypothetical protein